MVYLKLLLFAFSSLGSFQLIRKLTKDTVDIHFLPSLTIAIQVTILFFAGILNLLYEFSLILYITGLVSLFINFINDKRMKFLKDYINDGYIISVIIMIVMGFVFKGELFYIYDDFSHWALVVKNMLLFNRFPNFENYVIEYQSYPLGSSCFVYYFSRMIGESESIQMLGQLYMIVTASLPLFSFVKKRSVLIDILYITIINFILIYNIRPNHLMVDTLLPVIGICALLFSIKHIKCDESLIKLWLLSFYLIEIIQIKNSGVFFVLTILFVNIRHYTNKANRFNRISALILPFISILLWHKHCKYVFSAASTTRHAMTVDNYKNIFGAKSFDELKTTCLDLLKMTFTYRDVLLLFTFILVIGCLVWFLKKNNWKEYKKCFLFTLVFYLCYQIGTLGMYLFSMPSVEATHLAGSDRYLRTIIVAILMIYASFLFESFSDLKLRTKSIVVSVVVLCIFAVQYYIYGHLVFATNCIYPIPLRLWTETCKDAYNIPDGESYCILIPGPDNGYSYYLYKYVFQSTDVTSVTVNYWAKLDEINARYVFIYDENNEKINSWVRNNYPDQYGNEVIICEDYENE